MVGRRETRSRQSVAAAVLRRRRVFVFRYSNAASDGLVKRSPRRKRYRRTYLHVPQDRQLLPIVGHCITPTENEKSLPFIGAVTSQLIRCGLSNNRHPDFLLFDTKT